MTAESLPPVNYMQTKQKALALNPGKDASYWSGSCFYGLMP